MPWLAHEISLASQTWFVMQVVAAATTKPVVMILNFKLQKVLAILHSFSFGLDLWVHSFRKRITHLLCLHLVLQSNSFLESPSVHIDVHLK